MIDHSSWFFDDCYQLTWDRSCELRWWVVWWFGGLVVWCWSIHRHRWWSWFELKKKERIIYIKMKIKIRRLNPHGPEDHKTSGSWNLTTELRWCPLALSVGPIGSDKDPRLNSQKADLIGSFISWLHVEVKVSLPKCQTAWNFIVQMMAPTQESNGQALNSLVPKDTRTILKGLNIKLLPIRCCPNCFSLYNGPDTPSNCTYCKTPKSRPCNPALFHEQTTFSNISLKGKISIPQQSLEKCVDIKTPTSVFITQKLMEWLPWFLNLPGIKEAITNIGV